MSGDAVMTALTLRKALRWLHLIAGAVLATYVFSPLHADPVATAIVRALTLPLVIATGLVMWQQGRLIRLMGRASRPLRDP
jgi:thiosulfate reductase cytochrome b subunit